MTFKKCKYMLCTECEAPMFYPVAAECMHRRCQSCVALNTVCSQCGIAYKQLVIDKKVQCVVRKKYRNPTIQVFIKTDQCTYRINIGARDPVIRLKNKLEKKSNYSREAQILMYRGKILYDYVSLHRYEIRENSTLYHLSRLRGD